MGLEEAPVGLLFAGLLLNFIVHDAAAVQHNAHGPRTPKHGGRNRYGRGHGRMMLPGTDCVFVLRGVPVKRHRGEPGHTRDTRRTHKGTGISVDFETDQHPQHTRTSKLRALRGIRILCTAHAPATQRFRILWT